MTGQPLEEGGGKGMRPRPSAHRLGAQDQSVISDLDALLTALYVQNDDEIGGTRWLCRPPQLTDSELVTLAVEQAMLGFISESR
ncbi:hypothetical protein ABZ819_34280 [Streptomyces venezuelae]